MAKRKTRVKKAQSSSVTVLRLDNPMFNPAHPESNSNPSKIMTPVSMRESPAIWMHGHGQLDECQLRAAGTFRMWYEMAGGGNVKAMDTSKEPVDGGSISDGITDRKIRAGNELKAIHTRIGPKAYWLVQIVCGQCVWIKDIDKRKRAQLELANQLREHLNSLSVFWGYTTKTYRNAKS